MHDWEAIRAEHGEIVWAIIFRIVRNEADASDCYQEVLLEAYRKTSEGNVRNLPGLLRWLAAKRAIDSMRRSSAGFNARAELHDELPVEQTLQDSLEFEEMVERVRAELAYLPPNQAEAFWICCVEEISYREASQAMGISVSHLGVLVSRARRHLQLRLSEWGEGRPTAPNTKPVPRKT